MAINPMRYTDALSAVLALELPADVSETLTALKSSIDKKNSADRKPTKTQEANASIKNDIMSVMADGTSRTITEIISAVPSLNGATNQKASALVKQLVEANLLKREEVKRKAYFTIIV